MPRYVILEHDMPLGSARLRHWDFMLEYGAVLRTWAAPEPPQVGAALEIEQIADHRPAYLDYEGPISGGRGSVTRWDAGEYELLAETPLELLLTLAGQRLSGRAWLRREHKDAQRWNLSITSE